MPPVGADALARSSARTRVIPCCTESQGSEKHRKAAAVRLQDRAMTYAFLSASGTLTAWAKAASKRVVQKSHISSFTFSTSRR